MNKAASPSERMVTPPLQEKEKILFEIQPFMLPTILNIENLSLIGITFVIMLAVVAFHAGGMELLLIGAAYLLLAVPSFVSIFRAGSTSYILTNKRLVIFRISFGQREQSIPLDQIDSTKFKTSGLQRVYGAGDVIVYLKGLRKPVKLVGLRGGKKFAEQITQASKKFQNKA